MPTSSLPVQLVAVLYSCPGVNIDTLCNIHVLPGNYNCHPLANLFMFNLCSCLVVVLGPWGVDWSIPVLFKSCFMITHVLL